MCRNQFLFHSRKASLCRSNKGFALILLLSALPVLLTIALTVSLGLSAFLAQRKQRHECRSRLLQYQSLAKETIEKVQALNARARILRTQRKIALAMMVVPPTAIQGARLFQSVRRQQQFLRTQQTTLLTVGKFRLAQILKKRPYLAIRPDDPTDTAPVYVLENQFSNKQAQQISWKSRFAFAGDEKWIGMKTIEIKESCAATLVETASGLQPQLSKAKSWPNFSSPLSY